MGEFVRVARADEVPDGFAICALIDGAPVAVFNSGGRFYAIGDTCTHEEASLSEGDLVDEYTVECPLHGSSFDIRTGQALTLPATGNAGSYEVRVRDGEVEVRVPE